MHRANGIESQSMSEPSQSAPETSPDPPIFGAPPPDRAGLPPAVWASAALIVLVIVGGLFFISRNRGPGGPLTLQPADPYAASLPITGQAMSEGDSLSGAKVTYLDGHIQNAGGRTVTGATVQVVFGNDEAMPPEVETVPLTLIRTTQPYIDTEPVSADPLKPGDAHAFRLAFESVPQNWNQQMPEVRIIATQLK